MDVRRIASYINNDIFDYVSFVDGLRGSKLVKGDEYDGVMVLKKEENGDCVFLLDNICQIYPVRPLACQMYPANPIFHETKTGHTLELKYDENCPGLGLSKPFTITELIYKWRKERLLYDKVVDKWKGNLIDFVRMLINNDASS
jgi:Fe-S-cluster containining protein